MYYVYELVNLMGTVEYVGETKNVKERFRLHTKVNPEKNRQGKFYKRQDINMHVVATYETKAQSRQAEYELQIFWNLPTDRSKRSNKGSKNGRSKLTENQVKKIKSLLAQKISCAEIARRFKVHRTCIGFIKQGKLWSHIKQSLES